MSAKTGLGRQAYEPLAPGEEFVPYVPAGDERSEFTVKAVIAGAIFGVLFGAANAYLGLRAGLTISTSIPVAVMTVAVFRLLARGGVSSTILEANLAQTIGSASSSVASGVIFTLPALFLWGHHPTLLRMTLLALAGGLIGVLFMIPLRRFLIEREHGRLPYPEGTACAEVLVASELGGGRARNVFLGLGVGAALKAVVGRLKLLPSEVGFSLPWPRKAELSCEISAALFGVGFILGPRIGAIMVGGGLLSSLVIIPVIAAWGEARLTPLYPETTRLVAEMSAGEIWNRYVRYIGAGAVAAGGFVTLVRSIPTMLESFRIGAGQLRQELGEGGSGGPRTQRDLPLAVVGWGLALVGLALTALPQAFGVLGGVGARAVAVALVVVFAFFFVTVSSRIVGLVGVTSNPTSGMTIASLLGTAVVFVLLGWSGDPGKVAALSVGCVIAIAASIAGDTSQDLKTGFILGATPRRQQIGELIGVLTSAVFVCGTLLLLNEAYGFGTRELAAPQATLMKVVVEGVLEQSLPWGLVGIGVGIALAAEALRLPSLAFAVGVYLPLGAMLPVFLGGALSWWLTRGGDASAAEARERGVLFGSGLVGGEGLLGVLVAGGVAWLTWRTGQAPEGVGYAWLGTLAPWLSALLLAALAWGFARASRVPGRPA